MQKISALLLAIFILLSASLPGRCQAYSSSTTTIKNNFAVKGGNETVSGTITDTGETVQGPMTVTGASTITGNQAITGNLSVTGATATNSLTVNGVTINTNGTGGTVTSVGVTVPSDETVSPSTITSSGVFGISRNTQTGGMVLAGPNIPNATAAVPTFKFIDRVFSTGGASNIRPLPCNAPAAPVIANGGTPGATSYSYAVTAVMPDGLTITAASTATANATGNATLTGTNTNIVTWTAVPGAGSYQIYRTASSGTPSSIGLLSSTALTTFTDTGIAGAGFAAPTAAVLTGDYYNGATYTQNQPFSCVNVRIYNTGTLTLAGALTVFPNASGGTALNGAFIGSCGTGIGEGAGGSISPLGGGSGGGFGGAGGRGGYLTSVGLPTCPSATYSISQALSGSGGGAGGGTASPGSGGNGGGGFYLESNSPVIFGATSAVTANGANGVTATASSGGGGGGGSGGAIQVRCSNTVTINSGCTITASGGNGGASLASGPGGGSGGGGYIEICGSTVTNSGTITAPAGTVSGAGTNTTAALAGSSGVINLYSFVQGPRSCP